MLPVTLSGLPLAHLLSFSRYHRFTVLARPLSCALFTDSYFFGKARAGQDYPVRARSRDPPCNLANPGPVLTANTFFSLAGQSVKTESGIANYCHSIRKVLVVQFLVLFFAFSVQLVECFAN